MKRNQRRKSLGSTIVEVLMAMSVLAVGASGIIALQKVTVVANRDARTLEVANRIAQTWMERLKADATRWHEVKDQPPNISQARWLAGHVNPSGTESWFRPIDTTNNLFGVHDSLGRDDPTGSATGPFCVNVRLMWLDAPNVQKLMRAEVRVYWLRNGVQNMQNPSIVPPNPLCGATSTPVPIVDGATDVLHFVHVVDALVAVPEGS